MKLNRIVSVTCLAAFLGGCKTVSLENAKPAVVTSHSDQSISALRAAIKDVLNNTQVTVAGNAFTQSSRLVLQRKPIIGPDGLPVQTRVDESPITIKLYKVQNKCVIEYVQNAKLKIVEDLECEIKAEK
ncbi:MAG: hypothetical protein OQK51_01675 [Kangiellaceae bacterium]|nr:hypothetical protein [Kangiellaceae bacterium]